MKTKRNGIGAILCAGCLLFAGTAFSQTSSKINWERMQRDLDIMEGVLSKLLLRSSFEPGGRSDNVNGVYFAGYGVVFLVKDDQLRVLRLSADQIEHLKELAPQVIVDKTSDDKKTIAVSPEMKSIEVMELDAGKRLERFKSRTIDFLGDYADAVGQLDPDERVTVVLDFGGSRPFQIMADRVVRGSQAKDVAIVEISARKSDIINHRRGQLSQIEFRKRVEISERGDDESMNANIDIMANILETALSRRHHEDYYIVDQNRGIYLKKLGTLFFLSAELNTDTVTWDVHLLHTPRPDEVVVQPSQPKAQKRPQKSISELQQSFKNTLVELVGDYGHTLRTLEPTEQVVVAVNFNNLWGLSDEATQRFVLTVRKQELDAYNRGNITLAEFKQKVQVQDY